MQKSWNLALKPGRQFVAITFLMMLLVGISTLIGRRAESAPSDIPFQSGFPISPTLGSVSYSSPGIIDYDKNGTLDIIAGGGNGCVYAYDHAGDLLDGFPINFPECKDGLRIRGPVAIGDLDFDSDYEIVYGKRGASNNTGERGQIHVWESPTRYISGWPFEMAWNSNHNGSSEISAVGIANVSGSDNFEVVATTTNKPTDRTNPETTGGNLYVLTKNGVPLNGFPVYYLTAAIFGGPSMGDLNGDGYAEITTGRDHVYFHAYDSTGNEFGNWPVRTYLDQDKTTWGVDLHVEYTSNTASIADLDDDGSNEVMFAGRVRDFAFNRDSTSGALAVLNGDGSRHPGWERFKRGGEIVYTGSYRDSMAPAIGDIDGDGKLDVVVNLNDGSTYAFKENGELIWSYDFANGQTLMGGEPVIGDINADGCLDVVYGTYSPDESAASSSRLIALDHTGQILDGFPLEFSVDFSRARVGMRNAPALADLDGDGDIEIVAVSRAGAVYAWDLDAAINPDLLPWPMGRHDVHRTGDYGFNSSYSYNSPNQAQPCQSGGTIPTPTAEPTVASPTATPQPSPTPDPTSCIVTDIGETKRGMAAVDDATGTGYVMFSTEKLRDRFTSNRPLSSAADHLIPVLYDDETGWQYMNNSSKVPFTPDSGDRLIASVDFSEDIVTMLSDSDTSVEGIPAGVSDSDITIFANQWNGSPNAGEFYIVGTQFLIGCRDNEDSICSLNIGELGRGVPGYDPATGPGYLMYSETPVRERFENLRNYRQADNFILVRFTNGQWEYDNNTGYLPFTPASSDLLVASIDFGSEAIELLDSDDQATINSIQAGYIESDLEITADRWNGSSNAGEYLVYLSFMKKDGC